VASRQYDTQTRHTTPIRTRRVGGHARHGRCIVVACGVFLCLGGELGVRGMAEAHQTEALGVGRVFLYGRRRRGVVIINIIMACRGPRRVGGRGPEAIFRGSYAARGEILVRLVEARVLVGASEEAGRVEGAPSLEVSFAAAGAEGAQRHGCSRRLAAHEGRYGVTVRYMAQRRGQRSEVWGLGCLVSGLLGWLGCGTPVRLRECC
jgi:hypothetical protein